MASKDELIAQAEEMGLDVSGAWTKTQLAKAIAEAAQEEVASYRNIGNVKIVMFGVKVLKGEIYTPTEANKQSESGVAKLSRLVSLGFVEKV